jgi:hypothetical protein
VIVIDNMEGNVYLIKSDVTFSLFVIMSTVLKNMDLMLIYYITGQKISLHSACSGFQPLNCIKSNPLYM